MLMIVSRGHFHPGWHLKRYPAVNQDISRNMNHDDMFKTVRIYIFQESFDKNMIIKNISSIHEFSQEILFIIIP